MTSAQVRVNSGIILEKLTLEDGELTSRVSRVDFIVEC